MATHAEGIDEIADRAITRRRLLTVGAQGAVAITGAGALAGLLTDAADASATPSRGGTLTIGSISGGPTESLNPNITLTFVDYARDTALFDTLFDSYNDLRSVKPGLALSAHSNKTANLWTLELRPGVKWHDGKPFTADDVVYTIKQWQNPQAFATNGYVASIIDFAGVRKRGPLTVEIPTHIPIAQLPTVLWPPSFSVVQNGTTFADLRRHPVGTGPFKFVSFEAGRQSVFVANHSYWASGKPYVDRLVIDSSFTDENTRFNALLSGQIDAAFAVSPLVAKEHASSSQVTVQHAPQNNSLNMDFRVDKGPFVDVRVRQALKLLIDRPAIIEGALYGFGSVSNDVYGAGDVYYNASLKTPAYDPERAKSLLKAAGRQGLSFDMPVAEVLPGFVEAATLFAEQAKAGGVKIRVVQQNVNNYFSTADGYLTRPLAFDYTGTSLSMTQQYLAVMWAKAAYNDTHWGQQSGGAADDKLLFAAIGATDPAKAQRLWNEVQQLQYNDGGVIIFANADAVDAVGPRVHGLKTTPVENLNGFRFQDAWVS